MKKRLPEIDDIRGFSIIVMILIHTNAYFWGNGWAKITMEMSQFAVVAFIFCSIYLTLLKSYPATLGDVFAYFYKRLKRLIIPYYIFLVCYLGFLALINHTHYSLDYIVSSFLMTGGVDFGWLVILFIQIMVITPILQFLYEKQRFLLYLYTAVALVSSIIFLKFTPFPYYRAIMWLPWSLVIVYTMYFKRIWQNKWMFVFMTVLLGVLYVVTQQAVLVPLHRSLTMYDNKYPPNLYHIAYSLFAVNILYFLSRARVFTASWVQSTIHFFSVHSYSIFFIHLVVIAGVWKWVHPNNWILFYLLVAYISVLLQLVFNKLASILQKPIKK